MLLIVLHEPDEQEQPILSASEALYGFCAWLTTRPRPITMSEKHDAAPVVELIKRFCEVNDIADPREGWHLQLVHPPHEEEDE